MYTVRLSIGEEVIAEREFEVLKDPRLTMISQEDLVAQFELVQTINAKLDSTHKTINRIREVRNELNETLAELKDDKSIQEKAKAMMKAISLDEFI